MQLCYPFAAAWKGPELRRILSELIKENYPAIAKDLLNPLLEFLQICRQVCGDDIDRFLILLVVGVRTAQDQRFACLDVSKLDEGSLDVLPSLGTNMRSIAESTGIPKETVRRKLSDMIEAGWLVRHGNDVRLTGHAWVQLASVRDKLSAMTIRNWEVVSSLLVEHAQPETSPAAGA